MTRNPGRPGVIAAIAASVAIAAARAGCVHHRAPMPPAPRPAPVPTTAALSPAPAPAPVPARAPAEAATPSDVPPASVIPAAAHELITGVIDDWRSTRVTLRRWRRNDTGPWAAGGDAWQGVIGTSGAAWGSGLHGSGAPDGHTGPIKHEGDGKSPAGAFALRGVYGYAAAPPRGTAVPYVQVTADWDCVDDPASKHYTRIVDRRGVTVDWTSAEQMRRRDELYTWVIDIAHNRAAAPGAGSCIFFHVWGGPTASTVGCTAMPEPELAQLIAGLDPTAVYVLLPRAEYDAFAATWGLPAGEK